MAKQESYYLTVLKKEYEAGRIPKKDYEFGVWSFTGSPMTIEGVKVFSGLYDGKKRKHLNYHKNEWNEYGRTTDVNQFLTQAV